MNLLDKYMLEVGKHLPRKHRLDLQAEIRSTIEDMLEDRSLQSGKPVDDTLISEVLQEYGAPAKVATAYKPTRYLIGPRHFPFFEMVVKIVLAVLSVVALVGLGINLAGSGAAGPALLKTMGQAFLQYLGGVISAFGYIVLVFAILERVLPASEFEEEAERWEPKDLNAVPDPNQIQRSDLIFEVLFIALGLALLNLWPNLVEIAVFGDNTWIYIPALSEAFFRYLPWINLLGIIQILLDLYLLRQVAWKTATRLIKLAVEVAGIVLAAAMLAGPPLVSLDNAKLAEILGESSGLILKLFYLLPSMVLIIVIVVQSIEVLQIIRDLLNNRNAKKTFFPA